MYRWYGTGEIIRYTAEDLVDLYNDAVELIWDLKYRLHETREFLDMFIEVYI